MQRSLAAILAADVVGYSRLMGKDEAGTLAELRRYRDEIFDPKAAQHQGRIVKLMGDGTLMEFSSVVDAVTFAVDLQVAMARRNAGVPEERRIIYRIGINLGDIVHQDDDIYGDGVNVAARLEGLAEPGGICISRSARDQVRDKLDLNLDDQGEIEVKNIARPVRVFRVLIDDKAAALTTPVTMPAQKATSNRKPIYAAVMAGCLLLAAGVFWWQPWMPGMQTASVERMALPLPAKPSIAVLPFTNISGNLDQELFSDGMTDDLITDLSKVSGLFVIARNTSFTFKGKTVASSEVAEKLGVRYVLEGSVRRSGDQVRVNAQLIDATTGGHLWAERYDGDITDYFMVQDTFVHKIVTALSLKLSRGEQEEIAKGQTANVEARKAFQKGWQQYNRYTAKSNALAAQEFLRATVLDPNYGRAYSALSMAYVRGCQWRWHKELGTSNKGAFIKATAFLAKAEKNSSSMTKVAASQIYLYDDKHGKSFNEAARAIALDPNDPEAQVAMGLAMITTGKPEAGLEFVKTAVRLSPSHPTHYSMALALGYFALKDMEQAVVTLEATLKRNPSAVDLAPLLAASYAHLGRKKEARAALRLWKPEAGESELQSSYKFYHFPYTLAFSQRKVEERLSNGLAVAGLPDGITVVSLTAKLQQGETPERIEAARFLLATGTMAAEAVPELIVALGDKNEALRRNAIEVLGRIGPVAKSAIPALEALRDQGILTFPVGRALRNIQGL